MAGYSDDEIEAIAAWLREALSANEIADRFGQQFRRYVSRNGIIGIVHRNKVLKAIGFARAFGPREALKQTPWTPGRKNVAPLKGRKGGFASSPSQLPGRLKLLAIDDEHEPDFDALSMHARAVAKPREVVSDRTYDAASLKLRIADLRDGQCRFPVNDSVDPGGHLFCGLAVSRVSYCAHHANRAFGGYRAEDTSPLTRRRIDSVFA